MRVVVQRVKEASVAIEGAVVGQINQGYLLLVGFGPDDTEATLDYLVHKIVNLRVFESKPGKMDRNLRQVGGAILSVSQFTLYADLSHGNRPGFTTAAKPELASRLYDQFNAKLAATGIPLATGHFGADMQVSLVNDGPVTILYER